MALLAALILLVVFPGCGSPAGSNDPGPGDGGDGLVTGDQQSVTAGGVTFALRYVPGGTFMIDKGDNNDPSAENHNMTISKGYWVGETEVTQELFEAVMGTNPSTFSSSPASDETQEKRPVEMVSWYDAIAFCNKLSLLDGLTVVYSVSGISDWTGLAYGLIPTTDDADWNAAAINGSATGYRLPTEMEWMWAAMGATEGGTASTGYAKGYAGSTEGSGQTNIDNYAWYTTNSSTKTHEVGKKTANELGIKDMTGNVWEWCWDWYGSYPTGPVTDFLGADSGTRRVLRGGAWDVPVSSCVVSYQLQNVPIGRYYILGFRVVRAD
jgi:formylglycine-generating enzyme required for sulfatase activity